MRKQSIEFNALGDECKRYESACTQTRLLAGVPVVARLDGRAFHTFCRGLDKPYDIGLTNLMRETSKYLLNRYCADLAYTQSDEITLVWLNKEGTSKIPFDLKLFKLTSLLAASCSVFFNKNIEKYVPSKADSVVEFDCRIWNVPSENAAAKTVMWREMDATRNSISMAAQANFSHNELQRKSTKKMLDMLINERGINWNSYPNFFKKGSYFSKKTVKMILTKEELMNLPEKHYARKNPDMEFERSIVSELDIPPLTKVDNIAGVLFYGDVAYGFSDV